MSSGPKTTVSFVWEGLDRAGAAMVYAVPEPPARATKADYLDLAEVHLYKAISSVEVFSAPEATSNLILFEKDEFAGGFLQFTNAQAASGFHNLAGDWGLGDRAGSLIQINTQRKGELEFPRSFRDTFVDRWRFALEPMLMKQGARRESDPIMTWDPFPRGKPPLDPTLMYLRITQRIVTPPPFEGMPPPSAWIQFHIRLDVTSGPLTSAWIRPTYQVDPSLWSGVYSWLSTSWMENLRITMQPQLDARLADLLSVPQLGWRFPVKGFYLLPGRQLSLAGTGVRWGTTYEDATIVCLLW